MTVVGANSSMKAARRSDVRLHAPFPLLAVSLIAVSLLASAGCASTGTRASTADNADPWESFNRPVYRFNDALDRYALKPVATAYTNWTPEILRFVLRNFFSNLEDVYTTANQLLQGKPYEALTDATRVVVNSTLGFGGLGDPASDFGLRKHHEDLGQTLGRWGVPSGPYLVLPFLGPSSLRDAPARYVNSYADPVWWPNDWVVNYSAWGVRAIDERAALLPREKLLNDITFDRYTLIRDGYLQMRLNAVYDGNVPQRASTTPAADPSGVRSGSAGKTPDEDDFDPGPTGAGSSRTGGHDGTGSGGDNDEIFDPGPTPGR